MENLLRNFKKETNFQFARKNVFSNEKKLFLNIYRRPLQSHWLLSMNWDVVHQHMKDAVLPGQ